MHFTSTITRKQYGIRLLLLIAAVFLALISFVYAPEGKAVEVAGIVYVLMILFAIFYHVFGLAVPRLRSAQISLWAILLIFVPLGILVLIGICLLAPDKRVLSATFQHNPP
jgi:uncharacterized membrane protein YhaH (DUF805 family)